MPTNTGTSTSPDNSVPDRLSPQDSIPDGSDLGALNDYLDRLRRPAPTSGGDSGRDDGASGSSGAADTPEAETSDGDETSGDRPDGEYTDETGTSYVSTDSNGNRHTRFYKRHENGGLYLDSHTLDRPDGSSRVYDWPGHRFGGSSQNAEMSNARRRDLLSSSSAHSPDLGQVDSAGPDVFSKDFNPNTELNPGNYQLTHEARSEAVGSFNDLVASHKAQVEEFKNSDSQSKEWADSLNAEEVRLTGLKGELNSWGTSLQGFYENNSDSIFAAAADRADRSSFTPQYEFLSANDPTPPIEDADDYSRVSFDLGRAQKVLNVKQAELNARIDAYKALPENQKDPALGKQLYQESAQLEAERKFQGKVIAHLTEKESVLDRDVNPYSAHGKAIRRHNLYSEMPISQVGLTGADSSDDGDGRTIYTPEYATYFGEVTGERVTGDPKKDTAMLNQSLAAQDEALENDVIGTGRVYTESVERDAEGNVIDKSVGAPFQFHYDPGVEGEKARNTPRNRFRTGQATGEKDYGDRAAMVSFQQTLDNEGYENPQEIATDIRNMLDAGHFQEAGRLSALLNTVNAGIGEENRRQQQWLDENVNSPVVREMTAILASYYDPKSEHYDARTPLTYSDGGDTISRGPDNPVVRAELVRYINEHPGVSQDQLAAAIILSGAGRHGYTVSNLRGGDPNAPDQYEVPTTRQTLGFGGPGGGESRPTLNVALKQGAMQEGPLSPQIVMLASHPDYYTPSYIPQPQRTVLTKEETEHLAPLVAEIKPVTTSNNPNPGLATAQTIAQRVSYILADNPGEYSINDVKKAIAAAGLTQQLTEADVKTFRENLSGLPGLIPKDQPLGFTTEPRLGDNILGFVDKTKLAESSYDPRTEAFVSSTNSALVRSSAHRTNVTTTTGSYLVTLPVGGAVFSGLGKAGALAGRVVWRGAKVPASVAKNGNALRAGVADIVPEAGVELVDTAGLGKPITANRVGGQLAQETAEAVTLGPIVGRAINLATRTVKAGDDAVGRVTTAVRGQQPFVGTGDVPLTATQAEAMVHTVEPVTYAPYSVGMYESPALPIEESLHIAQTPETAAPSIAAFRRPVKELTPAQERIAEVNTALEQKALANQARQFKIMQQGLPTASAASLRRPTLTAAEAARLRSRATVPSSNTVRPGQVALAGMAVAIAPVPAVVSTLTPGPSPTPLAATASGAGTAQPSPDTTAGREQRAARSQTPTIKATQTVAPSATVAPAPGRPAEQVVAPDAEHSLSAAAQQQVAPDQVPLDAKSGDTAFTQGQQRETPETRETPAFGQTAIQTLSPTPVKSSALSQMQIARVTPHQVPSITNIANEVLVPEPGMTWETVGQSVQTQGVNEETPNFTSTESSVTAPAYARTDTPARVVGPARYPGRGQDRQKEQPERQDREEGAHPHEAIVHEVNVVDLQTGQVREEPLLETVRVTRRGEASTHGADVDAGSVRLVSRDGQVTAIPDQDPAPAARQGGAFDASMDRAETAALAGNTAGQAEAERDIAASLAAPTAQSSLRERLRAQARANRAAVAQAAGKARRQGAAAADSLAHNIDRFQAGVQQAKEEKAQAAAAKSRQQAERRQRGTAANAASDLRSLGDRLRGIGKSQEGAQPGQSGRAGQPEPAPARSLAERLGRAASGYAQPAAARKSGGNKNFKSGGRRKEQDNRKRRTAGPKDAVVVISYDQLKNLQQGPAPRNRTKRERELRGG